MEERLIPDSFAKYHLMYWFSCTYSMTCPSNHLDNETEIVHHLLYINFMTVNHDIVWHTLWCVICDSCRQTKNKTKKPHTKTTYWKLKPQMRKKWNKVWCVGSPVYEALSKIVFESSSNTLCSTPVHVNTLKSKLISGHFLVSIPLNLTDVRDQTQRKQSSTPKPQSEFSANVWVFRSFLLDSVNQINYESSFLPLGN